MILPKQKRARTSTSSHQVSRSLGPPDSFCYALSDGSDPGARKSRQGPKQNFIGNAKTSNTNKNTVNVSGINVVNALKLGWCQGVSKVVLGKFGTPGTQGVIEKEKGVRNGGLGLKMAPIR